MKARLITRIAQTAAIGLFLFVAGCDSLFGPSAGGTVIGQAMLSAPEEYGSSIDHGGITVYLQPSDGLDATTDPAPPTAATTTSADGTFRIENVTPGLYTLHGVSTRSDDRAVVTGVEVVAGIETDVGVLRLSPLGDVHGTVSVQGDTDLVGDLIVLIPGTSFAAQVDETGEFVIRDVPAFEEYHLLIASGDVVVNPEVSVWVEPGPNELAEILVLDSTELFPDEAVDVHRRVSFDIPDSLVADLGEGGALYLVPFAEGSTGVPVAVGSDDVCEYESSGEAGGMEHLYLFADIDGNGEPAWLAEPTVYIGTHETRRDLDFEVELLTLTGTVPVFSAGTSPDSLAVELEYPESGARQWSVVQTTDLDGDGKALDFRCWVVADREVSVSIRRRTGEPANPTDADWYEDSDPLVLVAGPRAYYTHRVVDAPESPGVEVLVVGDGSDAAVWDPADGRTGYRPLADHVHAVLDYAGIPSVDASIPQIGLLDLSRFAALVFVTEAIWKLGADQADTIASRVADGMGLVFGKRAYSSLLEGLIGVSGAGDWASGETTDDLTFIVEWLPGLEGLRVPEPQTGYSYIQFPLNDSPDAPAGVPMPLTNEPGGRAPLAWRLAYGEGRVFYWNTDLTEYVQLRGLLLHSILDVMPIGVARIANAGVFHIDDYPAAVTAGKREPVLSEYDLPTHEYYRDVWLPDMLEIASNRDMDYLFAVPFNYNLRTTPRTDGSWPFDEWERESIRAEDGTIFGVAEAERIRRAGHELSLHGYNHRSLLGEAEHSRDPNYWIVDGGSTATMRASVAAARSRWISDGLGPLPVTYIAPNNKIDAAGLLVLAQAFPEIRIFASDITIPWSKGGRIDFGPDPVNPHFFSLPRWTSGFYDSNRTRMAAVSQLALTGTWTHFVHPDDIYSNPTNYPDAAPSSLRNPQGLPWGGSSSADYGLYDELESLLDWSAGAYPWLEWLSTVQAVDRIRRAIGTEVHWEYDATAGSMAGLFEGEPGFLWVRLSSDRTLDESGLSGVRVVWKREDSGGDEDFSLYVLAVDRNSVRLRVADQ